MYFTEKFQEESIENMKDDVAKNETFSFISMKLKQAKNSNYVIKLKARYD